MSSEEKSNPYKKDGKFIVRELNNIKMGCCDSCEHSHHIMATRYEPDNWECGREEDLPEWTEGKGDCPAWKLPAHFCGTHRQWHQGECIQCLDLMEKELSEVYEQDNGKCGRCGKDIKGVPIYATNFKGKESLWCKICWNDR